MTKPGVPVAIDGAASVGFELRLSRRWRLVGGCGLGGGWCGAAIFRLAVPLALVGFGAAGTLRAELQWCEQRIHLEPPVGAKEVAGAFECVNRGTVPIRVLDVRSGCGCTVPGLDMDVILPGEKGILHAIFQVGDRQGRQSVAITVTTAEPAIVRHELTLEVTIKDVVIVTPRALVWRVGEEPTAKIFQVQPAAGFDFVAAQSTTPEFAVEVAGHEGGAVQLRVTPRDTWAKRDASIKIKMTQKQTSAVEFLARVQVN